MKNSVKEDKKIKAVKDTLYQHSFNDKEKEGIETILKEIKTILLKGGKPDESIVKGRLPYDKENRPHIEEEKQEAHRAKDIAGMLFLSRLSLRKNEIAIELFKVCSRYYDKNIHSNLIFGKGALDKGGGMCDLSSIGPLTYESPY